MSQSDDIVTFPVRVVLASKFPITRLSVNTEIDSLAVGDCDGAISIFNTESLKKVCIVLHHCPIFTTMPLHTTRHIFIHAPSQEN